MKATILAYVIALGGVTTLIFGFWGLYTAERDMRVRDYMLPIQIIAAGVVLIGLARALQLFSA